MTKGAYGIALRERLLKDKILFQRSEMYILDPDRLGEIVGATFQDLKLKRLNKKVAEYLASITA